MLSEVSGISCASRCERPHTPGATEAERYGVEGCARWIPNPDRVDPEVAYICSRSKARSSDKLLQLPAVLADDTAKMRAENGGQQTAMFCVEMRPTSTTHAEISPMTSGYAERSTEFGWIGGPSGGEGKLEEIFGAPCSIA